MSYLSPRLHRRTMCQRGRKLSTILWHSWSTRLEGAPPHTRAYTHTHTHIHTHTHTHTHSCLHAFTLLPSPILQHRIVNLELLGQYGSNAWRFHNNALQRMVTSEQKALDTLRAHTQEVNRCRKTEQTKAGEKLSQLEAQ